jgi:RimJ/RimL family protein N-acetyltransferase
MPIAGIDQPDTITISSSLRLRKFDGIFDFALAWYQDEDTVYLVDGVRKKYTRRALTRMYEYMEQRGELYFIEIMEDGQYQPIGDVTFWQDDMPIVIGDKRYRGQGIGRQVIHCLIERGRALGYDVLKVNEIYVYNTASRKCFESQGFQVYERTLKGHRLLRRLYNDEP